MVSMPVPVMRIRKMRMGVRQGRMLMQVLVGSARRHWRGMRMGVVNINHHAVDIGVAVFMVMQQRLVGVFVAVPLGQVQSDTDGHQHASQQQRHRDGFTQQRYSQQCACERRY